MIFSTFYDRQNRNEIETVSNKKVMGGRSNIGFAFNELPTQTITKMNSKQNKAKKRQDIQDYTFINI